MLKRKHSSMSQQGHPAITPRCEICTGRSTWDFLQDFYLRVAAAENYARRVEKDICAAQTTIQRYQAALAGCEASLAASWKVLNEERLDHRASREALTFERERHRETIELLERIFKEAPRSAEVTDNLSSRLATTPNLEAWQAVPTLEGFLLETRPIESTLFLTPPKSHQLGEHEGQTGSLVYSTVPKAEGSAKRQATIAFENTTNLE